MENTPKKRGGQKGHPKAGGRKKGTPNKNTTDKRAYTDRLVIYCMERIFNEKDQLDIREVMSIGRDYMPYFQGKIEPVADRPEETEENSTDIKKPEKVTITIK